MYSKKSPTDTFSIEYSLIQAQNDGIQKVIKEFVEESITLVNEKFSKVEKEYNRLCSTDEELSEIYYQHDFEPRRIASLELIESICNSSIGFLYSQFEVKFFELANIVRDKYKGTSIKDYVDKCKRNRHGIDLAKSYIIHTSNINISDLDGSWSKIKQFQNLRHCIVHRNGSVNKEQSIIDLSKQNANIEYHRESDKIYAKREYVLETSNMIFDYMFKIMERLSTKTKLSSLLSINSLNQV